MQEKNDDRAVKILQMSYLMHRAILQQHLQSTLHIEGLKLSDPMFLRGIAHLIEQDASIRMSDIADFFSITPAAISQVIRRLEDTGLVERIVCEEDRRSFFIRITTRGKNVLERDGLEKELMMEGLLAYLGEEDADTFTKLVAKIVYYFEEIKKEELKGDSNVKIKEIF